MSLPVDIELVVYNSHVHRRQQLNVELYCLERYERLILLNLESPPLHLLARAQLLLLPTLSRLLHKGLYVESISHPVLDLGKPIQTQTIETDKIPLCKLRYS
jgi:hypothetical protein